jgi:hypothetical protein
MPTGQYDKEAAKAKRAATWAAKKAARASQPTAEPQPIDPPVIEGDNIDPRDAMIAELQARLAALDAKSDPTQPRAVTTPATLGPHSLDSAPVNSKLVGTDQGVVFATPAGARILPKDDPASKLPDGAKITKVAEGRFEGWQLSPAIDCSLLVGATAMEVISGFVEHFHNGKGAIAPTVTEQPVAVDGTMYE